jgi:hypothetical protein
MFKGSQPGPIWIWGILLALLLILLSTRGRFTPEESALQQQFAPQPTVPGATPAPALPQFDLEGVSPGVAETVQDLWQGLAGGGQMPALTPMAENKRLRVEVNAIQRQGNTVQLRGQITNISSAEVAVPLSAFILRDTRGTSYTAAAGRTVQLAPGESTPLDLTVPLPEDRGLTLMLNLPPDPAVEQILLVNPHTE